MFSYPAVALSYRTGSIPQLICLIWVWSEPLAILSWVWVWSTSKTGMRGVKIWHRSMFSDPALPLSYWSGSIPWSICLIWVWSETFAILSWVWVWSTSKTSMRGVKIWNRLMFSDPAVALSYRTCSIPRSICLIWVENWSQHILCCTWVVLWQTSKHKTVFLLVKSGKENLCPLLNTLWWLLCNNEQTLTFAQILLAVMRTNSLPRGTITTSATNNTSFHFQSWDERSEVKGFPGLGWF